VYRWQLSLALLSLADAASLASEASYITGATCQRNFGGAESGGLAFGSPSPGFQNFHVISSMKYLTSLHVHANILRR